MVEESNMGEKFRIEDEVKKVGGEKGLSKEEVEAAGGMRSGEGKKKKKGGILLHQSKEKRSQNEGKKTKDVGEESEEREVDEKSILNVRMKRLKEIVEKNLDLDEDIIEEVKSILTNNGKGYKSTCNSDSAMKHIQYLSEVPTLKSIRQKYTEEKNRLNEKMKALQDSRTQALKDCRIFSKEALKIVLKLRQSGNGKIDLSEHHQPCNIGYCPSYVKNIQKHLNKAHIELDEEDIQILLKHLDAKPAKKKVIEDDVDNKNKTKLMQIAIRRNTQKEILENEDDAGDGVENKDERHDYAGGMELGVRVGDPPVIWVNKISKIDRMAGICAVCKKEVRRLDCHLRKYHFKDYCHGSQEEYKKLLGQCHMIYKVVPTTKKRPRQQEEEVNGKLHKKIKINEERNVNPLIRIERQTKEKLFLSLFKFYLETLNLKTVSINKKLRNLLKLFVAIPRKEKEEFNADYLVRVIEASRKSKCMEKVKAGTERKYADTLSNLITFITEDDTCSTWISLNIKETKKCKTFLRTWKRKLQSIEKPQRTKQCLKTVDEIKETKSLFDKVKKSKHYKHCINLIENFNGKMNDRNSFQQMKVCIIQSLLMNNTKRAKELCTFNFHQYNTALDKTTKNGIKYKVFFLEENKTVELYGTAKLVVWGDDLKRLQIYMDVIRPAFYKNCKSPECNIFPRLIYDTSKKSSQTCCHEMSLNALSASLKRFLAKCNLRKTSSSRLIKSTNLTKMRDEDLDGSKRKDRASGASHSVVVSDAVYDISENIDSVVNVISPLRNINETKDSSDNSDPVLSEVFPSTCTERLVFYESPERNQKCPTNLSTPDPSQDSSSEEDEREEIQSFKFFVTNSTEKFLQELKREENMQLEEIKRIRDAIKIGKFNDPKELMELADMM